MKPRLKKIKCLECGAFVENTVLGKCPKCTRVVTSLASSAWTVSSTITRRVERSNGEVVLYSIANINGMWVAIAVKPSGPEHQPIAQGTSLEDVIRAADAHATEWLKQQPFGAS